MQYIKILLLLCGILGACDSAGTATNTRKSASSEEEKPLPRVRVGAETLLAQLDQYLGDRSVALIANHTSRLPDGTHLVDTLLAAGVRLVKVFSPEHGFRGQADAGQRVRSQVDPSTGLPLVSLYGDNKKPTPEQLADVDVVIFDIQDVGARFYTYISTMSYAMEACAQQGKDFLVLDRPNPNGWYVDGPVMNPRHSSFIGLHPIPIVHGMTIGEYANLVNGEGWLAEGVQVELTVLPCEGYRHEMRWGDTRLPWVAPSPNLASEYAAYLYPALCWFEPTPVSVGRGTDSAFTIVGASWLNPDAAARVDPVMGVDLYGHQLLPIYFTPRSLPGKSTYPKFEDQSIPGYKIRRRSSGESVMLMGLALFRQFFDSYRGEGPFFNPNFALWPGTEKFQAQIEAGESPEAMYDSWEEEVAAFRRLRKPYLLYP